MQNTSYTNDETLRNRAQKIAGFVYHLFWYVIVNIFLFWLDYQENSRIDWAYWVLFGWGIGLLSQAFATFAKPNLEEIIYNKLKK
jgi:2TM domain